MDAKTLVVLDFPKILDRLAEFCDFSASAELARALTPTPDFVTACDRLATTTEARKLLSIHDLTIGGAHDIRDQVDLCARGGVLDPKELLDVHATLDSMRQLRRYFEKRTGEYPHLAEIALRLPVLPELIEAINRCITESGEVADSASPLLSEIRRQVRLTHERLLSRLQRYLSDPETAAKLQDTVITQRDGRYVIPLRAEFKGQIKAIIHDQSSTGATLFIEPLAVVELNNAYREAQLAEREEIRRILASLSAEVGKHSTEIIPAVAALAELDLALAKARYAEALHGYEPILLEMPKAHHRPSSPNEARHATPHVPTIKLLNARHPLLDPQTVVPITIDPPPGTFAVVITGPNTGGKTVTLKTVGLLAIMAQSGLHIPADSGSALPCFNNIFADIGDEQSIEQSLSTFSGHINNIIRILKKADRRSLVILDELGAGTDPQEGAALARAILAHLLQQHITTFVATHYPELKTFAHSTEGVVNASLEFDIQTLRPTYKLTLGLPGRSNALAIASRLGMPQEIIEAARAEVNPEHLRTDKLIGDIQRQRKEASKERQKAEQARAEARRLERELAKRLDKIEEERQQILEQARAEAELELEVLKAQLKMLRDELRQARQSVDVVETVAKKIEEVQEKIQTPLKARKQKPAPAVSSEPLKVGERVRLANLNTEGVITAISGEDAEVMVGSLRVRARLEDLRRKDVGEESAPALETQKRRVEAPAPIESQKSSIVLPPSPGIELDLRGLMAEEALDQLETYLDKAYLAGMPFVRIIHGKGTGKLRQVVREALRGHPHVKSFEEGGEKEGGEGVTVVMLNS